MTGYHSCCLVDRTNHAGASRLAKSDLEKKPDCFTDYNRREATASSHNYVKGTSGLYSQGSLSSGISDFFFVFLFATPLCNKVKIIEFK